MHLFDIIFPGTEPSPSIQPVEPSPWGWIAIGIAVFLGLAVTAFLIFKNSRK